MPLPTYSFEPTSFWVEPKASVYLGVGGSGGSSRSCLRTKAEGAAGVGDGRLDISTDTVRDTGGVTDGILHVVEWELMEARPADPMLVMGGEAEVAGGAYDVIDLGALLFAPEEATAGSAGVATHTIPGGGPIDWHPLPRVPSDSSAATVALLVDVIQPALGGGGGAANALEAMTLVTWGAQHGVVPTPTPTASVCDAAFTSVTMERGIVSTSAATVAAAGLVGLARSVRREVSVSTNVGAAGMVLRSIDLEPGETVIPCAAWFASKEEEIAVRGGQVYVRRLRSLPPHVPRNGGGEGHRGVHDRQTVIGGSDGSNVASPENNLTACAGSVQAKPLEVNRGGTYLITGGLGGLGLTAANDVVAPGGSDDGGGGWEGGPAGGVVLTSRTGRLAPGAATSTHEAFRRLVHSDAVVTITAADVATAEGAAHAVKTLRTQRGPAPPRRAGKTSDEIVTAAANTPEAAEAVNISDVAAGADTTHAAADSAAARTTRAERTSNHTTVPLEPRAIFHAAGTLADASLYNQTEAGIRSVAAPKVAGLAALERAAGGGAGFGALGVPVVLFSSVTSLLGWRGQANYAVRTMEQSLSNYTPRSKHAHPPFKSKGDPITFQSKGAMRNTNVMPDQCRSDELKQYK